MPGRITRVSPTAGLSIALANNVFGKASLTDLSDDYAADAVAVSEYLY